MSDRLSVNPNRPAIDAAIAEAARFIRTADDQGLRIYLALMIEEQLRRIGVSGTDVKESSELVASVLGLEEGVQ